MRHWGSALFPLSLLLVLTLLTLWLRYATELDEPNRDGKHRHDPDYILNDIVMRRLDQDGQLRYTLRAANIRHYPDNDTTDLLSPLLTHQNRRDAKPPVTISADRGRLSNDNERVDLHGDVRIYRAPSGKYEKLTAFMNELTAFPNEETASTQSPVLIMQGKSWVKGVGMRVDNRAQIYAIQSRAVGLLESRHAAKNESAKTQSEPAGAKAKSTGKKKS